MWWLPPQKKAEKIQEGSERLLVTLLAAIPGNIYDNLVSIIFLTAAYIWVDSATDLEMFIQHIKGGDDGCGRVSPPPVLPSSGPSSEGLYL